MMGDISGFKKQISIWFYWILFSTLYKIIYPIKGKPLEITSKNKQNEKNKEHYTCFSLYIWVLAQAQEPTVIITLNRGY